MGTPRFIVSDSGSGFDSGESWVSARPEIELPPEESAHLRNSLRLVPGDAVEVFCLATRRLFLARVSGEPRNVPASSCAVVEVVQELSTERTPVTYLLVGIPKPAACDLITEKCAELGVDSVTFFSAERSQRRFTEKEKAGRLGRLERIRTAAMKQSRSTTVTVIALEDSLSTALENSHGSRCQDAASLRLICMEPWVQHPAHAGVDPEAPAADKKASPPAPQAPGIADVLLPSGPRRALSGDILELTSQDDDLYLIVGPEGGFTLSERELAASYGYIAVSLGKTVLRTETAALVACGLAQLFRHAR